MKQEWRDLVKLSFGASARLVSKAGHRGVNQVDYVTERAPPTFGGAYIDYSQ